MSLIPRISVHSQSHSHIPEYPEKLVQGLRACSAPRQTQLEQSNSFLMQMHMGTEILPGEDKVLEGRCSTAADKSSQGKGKFKCTPLLHRASHS